MSKKTIALVVVCLSSAALAGDKKGTKFEDGLSDAEVVKLSKSLGVMESKYEQAKPQVEKLKKNDEVKRSARLLPIASEALKHYANIGVFIAKMNEGLKAKDAKVNAYETQLKGEISQFDLKMAALKKQAEAAHAQSVVAIAAATVVVVAALEAAYSELDSLYDVAVADVDLVLIPVYDPYADVVYVDPYAGVQLPATEADAHDDEGHEEDAQ